MVVATTIDATAMGTEIAAVVHQAVHAVPRAVAVVRNLLGEVASLRIE
jgi:hypothetical protein